MKWGEGFAAFAAATDWFSISSAPLKWAARSSNLSGSSQDASKHAPDPKIQFNASSALAVSPKAWC